jgi:ComF family protein
LSILRNHALNIRSEIKRFLPAQPCVLCTGMSHDGLWCAACDLALPYLDGPHCPVCCLPTFHGEVCGHCLTHPPLFTRTTAAFAYTFPLDKLIQAMKYADQLALTDAFAARLAQRIDSHDLPDHIIAMPLHPAKLRARGYNQSALLAGRIARLLDIELLSHACQRIRDTPSQSALPWKERHRNVHGAFHCTKDLNGKHIALVDDVMTTGASLNALAKAVLQQGAVKVSTWVVARTIKRQD